MSDHTPTPWTDDKFIAIPAGYDRLLLGMFKETPKVAVRVLAEENYQHAAKCVNEHDRLIEQLESIRAERDGLVEALREVKVWAMMSESVFDLVEETLAKYKKKL